MGMGMKCWTGTGNGNDSKGKGGNRNNNSHSRAGVSERRIVSPVGNIFLLVKLSSDIRTTDCLPVQLRTCLVNKNYIEWTQQDCLSVKGRPPTNTLFHRHAFVPRCCVRRYSPTASSRTPHCVRNLATAACFTCFGL